MKKFLVQNTLILTLAALINRFIGLCFRMYMIRRVGAEFVGVYSLILSCFVFFTSFVGSGMVITVSKVISEQISVDKTRHSSNTRILFRICILVSFLIGILFSVSMFFLSDFIASSVIMDTRAYLSVRILSLCIPLISISACFRGYFYATGKIPYIATEQLTEQIIEIVIFIVLMLNIGVWNLRSACTSIVLGTIISEGISCIYSFVLYLYSQKKIPKINRCGLGINRSIKKVLLVMIPIGMNSLIGAALSGVKNVMITTGLMKYGLSHNNSVSIYGTIVGVVLPMLLFPSVILSSSASLIIPKISEKNALNHIIGIKYISLQTLRATCLFSFLVCGIFLIFGKEISYALCLEGNIDFYLRVISPIIPLMYLEIMVESILNGLNKQMFIFICNTVVSVMCVLLIYLFLPHFGVKAFILILFLSVILNMGFMVFTLIRETSVYVDLINYVIKPVFSLLFSGMIVRFLSWHSKNSVCSTIVSILSFSIFYVVMLLITNSITLKDFNIPLKRR